VQVVEILALQTAVDPDEDVSALRAEIDDLVFDLFERGASRHEVRRFHETVGRVMEPEDDQAASA